MKALWHQSFKISSFHVDFLSKLKPSALMQLFQEAAGSHAQHIGVGYDLLKSRKLFWALSRFQLEMDRWPVWGDELTIETWPCGAEGPFFRRDFQLFNQDGKMIGRGVSGWLLLDAASMRPQRVSRLGIDLPLNEKRSMDVFPGRVISITDTEVFTKTVLYNEIDVNLHVNNTRYLDWVMDCFTREHFEQHTLTSFTLEFLVETLWGDEIKLYTGKTETGYCIEAISKRDDKVAFKAVTSWKMKNEE